jgi:hypothetical protein
LDLVPPRDVAVDPEASGRDRPCLRHHVVFPAPLAPSTTMITRDRT